MDYNSDFKYDLKVGQIKEKELGDIFNNSKVEVKYDLQALGTGNVFVEYWSRGKKSGLSPPLTSLFVPKYFLHLIFRLSALIK